MLWHRLALTAIGGVGVMLMAGCFVDRHGLTDSEQAEARRIYWPESKDVLLLEGDDGAVTTGKVIGRSLLGIITLGISEGMISGRETNAYALFANDLAFLKREQYYGSFMGLKKDEIIRKRGVPQYAVPDGAGGEVLVYESSPATSTVGNGFVYGSSPFIYGQPVQVSYETRSYVYQEQFFLSAQGICVDWKAQNR